NASASTIRNLTCGGLNVGGGLSVVLEGPFRDGAASRFSLGCTGSTCTIAPTVATPPVNTADPDCTALGCNFGQPLAISNPTAPQFSFCVLTPWSAPPSGVVDRATGAITLNVALASDVYVTGNATQPCPRCSAVGTSTSPGLGTCDRGPRAGLACTTTSAVGLTRDCLTGGASPPMRPCTPGGGQCIDGQHVGLASITLAPLTTGAVSLSNQLGAFCPGQSATGCFGQAACSSITENGSPAGPLTAGVPKQVTLAAVSCVPRSGTALLDDATLSLPGPVA